MNSYKKLINNSFIFAIGSMGSKLISFILVPLYTYYLSTEQYGTVDLVTTTVVMLLPVVSASIFEALLRFVMEKDKPTEVIMTNSLVISLIGFLIFLMFYPILNFFNVFGDNLIYLYIILLLQILERVFAQYVRAIGEIKIFALNGILLTLATGSLNILFLVNFKMGVPGYFLSVILANIISVLFLIIVSKAYKNIKFSSINKEISVSMLLFSIPMIPNALMWWLVNASSRYFILFFVGVGANGLFAVASKIPSLINLVNQVFTQAWQISAIEEYENKEKSQFYSNVFTYLSTVLFLGSSALIVIIKWLFDTVFAAEYYDAWRAVPFLLLATVFSSFSGFLGTNYIAAKQTKGVFKTSVYGGIISVIFNLVFIPLFGMIGAGISSMTSFFVIFLIRFFDTKKFIEMTINWLLFIKNILVIYIQIGVLMLNLSPVLEFSVVFTLFLILLFANRNLFKPLKAMMITKFKRKH